MVFKSILLAGSLVLLSAGANAEFIQSDYRESGDNLVVLDQVTGIEWLSLYETDGLSYEQGATLREEGGRLYGWRTPTYSEYASMLTSFFSKELSDAHLNFNISEEDRIKWTTFFGQTYHDRSAGYITKANGDTSISGAFHNNTVIGASYSNYSEKIAYDHYGTYLVSDGGLTFSSKNQPSINANNPNAYIPSSVPLPTSVGLLTLAMCGFFARRRTQ